MDQFPTQDILAMIRSPAGQKLLSVLQQDPAALAKAKQMAQAGNYSGVQDTFSSLLSDPEIVKLLQQLGGGNGG